MNRYDLLPRLIVNARGSSFWLTVLNLLMARNVPFNRPHRFKIKKIGQESIQTYGPYRRSNFNHIRGIHACAIATAAEFSAGFLLLINLDPAKYRLIMGKLDADYFYQAKKDIIAEAHLSGERLLNEVVNPLKKSESTAIMMTTDVRDISDNHVASVKTTWQVKRWEKVRTKV